VRREGKLELTDASRPAKAVAEGIPEGFRPADSERVTAKAQEWLAMPSPSPHHLQLLLVPFQRFQHRKENQLPVFIPQYRFRAALRMRHHAQPISKIYTATPSGAFFNALTFNTEKPSLVPSPSTFFMTWTLAVSRK